MGRNHRPMKTLLAVVGAGTATAERNWRDPTHPLLSLVSSAPRQQEKENTNKGAHLQQSKLPSRPRDHCTCLGISPTATQSDVGGLVSQTSDGEGDEDYRVILVPAKDHPQGTMRPVYAPQPGTPRLVAPDLSPEYGPGWGKNETEPIGYIPQVSHTFAYYDGSYALQNDWVGIAEATTSARLYSLPANHPSGKGHALMSIQEVSRIMLERCTTARCSVMTGGKAAEEHGYYSTLEVDDNGEALTITDGSETWVFHILSDPTGKSAIWAAQRVPDDHFAVVANMFIIREMDLTDSKNFLASEKMVQIAKQMGWYNPASDGPHIDFTKTFSAGEYAHPYYSARRAWRMLSHANPTLNLDPMLGYHLQNSSQSLPFSVPVAKKLSREDVFNFYRDHYENTDFDLTKGAGAGPYGNPMRYAEGAEEAKRPYGAWERSIDIYRTTMTHVAEVIPAPAIESKKSSSALPPKNTCTLWHAPGRATASVFVPVFIRGATSSPLRTGSSWKVEHGSLWWAANAVGNWMDLRWKDIRAVLAKYQAKLEPLLIDFAKEWHQKMRRDEDAEIGVEVSVQPAENNNIKEAVVEQALSSWSSSSSSSQVESSSGIVSSISGLIRQLESTAGSSPTSSGDSWQKLITEITSAHWQLFYKLMAQFQNGYVFEDGAAKGLGYPGDYLDSIGYESAFHAEKSQFDSMRARLSAYQKLADDVIAKQGGGGGATTDEVWA
ncbi:unnamed protein product [Amoebophrya sp. A25]|nr:unnamed protein product [Amoebophrya sp. A25]|eukprot:GSA25T00021794001.1